MNKFTMTVAILIGFLLLFWWAKNNSIDIPSYVDDSVINSTEEKKDKDIVKFVEKINSSNKKITSLQVSDMPMRLNLNGSTYRLNGSLSYQKEKHFRLKVHHKLTGLELDIGSNDIEFWFWSKRMQPPYLYFSKHENLAQTNLKTVFNPTWMIESLNIELTDTKKINKTLRKENLYYTYENRFSAIGDPVTLITTYSPENNCVVGRSLVNEDGRSIITTAYSGERINTLWHEENVRMEWDLSNKNMNVFIVDSNFKMPDYKNKIDLSK